MLRKVLAGISAHLDAELAELCPANGFRTPKQRGRREHGSVRMRTQNWRTRTQNWRSWTQNWRTESSFSARVRQICVANISKKEAATE